MVLKKEDVILLAAEFAMPPEERADYFVKIGFRRCNKENLAIAYASR